MLPAVHSTWVVWLAEHPGAEVLSKRLSPHGRYPSDPYEGYYRSSRPGIHRARYADDRLPAKAMVMGLVLNGEATAYPVASMEKKGTVNDVVGGVPVAVTYRAGGRSGAAFERTVAGRVLTFELQATAGDSGVTQPPRRGWVHRILGGGPPPVPAPPARLRDLETGSLWDIATGKAISGQLSGAQLSRLPVTFSFWFGWKDHHPGTGVFSL